MTRVLVLFASLLIFALPAHAQTPSLKIAVVDVQALMNDSVAAKDIQKQIEAYKEKFLGELAKEENSLREEEKTLAAQREKLGADEFAKQAKAFESKLLETRRKAQTKKRAFEEASGKAVGTLRAKMLEVVQSIASENGYNMILSKQSLVVGEKTFDVTADAMKKLNDALKSIPVAIKG